MRIRYAWFKVLFIMLQFNSTSVICVFHIILTNYYKISYRRWLMHFERKPKIGNMFAKLGLLGVSIFLRSWNCSIDYWISNHPCDGRGAHSLAGIEPSVVSVRRVNASPSGHDSLNDDTWREKKWFMQNSKSCFLGNILVWCTILKFKLPPISSSFVSP